MLTLVLTIPYFGSLIPHLYIPTVNEHEIRNYQKLRKRTSFGARIGHHKSYLCNSKKKKKKKKVDITDASHTYVLRFHIKSFKEKKSRGLQILNMCGIKCLTQPNVVNMKWLTTTVIQRLKDQFVQIWPKDIN